MSSLLKKKFSSSKSKTLLQLTSQRLKVLRNKQAINAKKARVDIGRLLEKGQDSNAKMQVEVVFREQKIMAVYELLDQFCQLILVRLESIKAQKECPFDVKEAVASLIFAAPRCAELVELQLVSKQFTAKYGTEFSAAAKELRPDCGVNKQVIQGLSTRSPNFNERLKLLKEIAVENNIKWDDETSGADNQWDTDLVDGLHFSNATELSEASTSAVSDSLRSMHRDEVKEQHQSPRPSLDTEAMPVERAQKFPDGAVRDPYALARSQGRMDYLVVSDYMKRAQSSVHHLESVESKQESRNRFPYGESAAPEQESGHHNAFSDASSCEDTPQRSKGRKDKLRHDAMDLEGRNGQDELSQLTDVAEYAVAAAANAAEAARATVEFVRMNSSEGSRGRKGVRTDKSSGPLSDENHRLDMASTVDRSEDSFKYVVFEETSVTQRETQSSTQVEESNIDTEPYAFPTFYARKSSDARILKAEHDGLGLEDVPMDAFFEGSYDKGLELPKTASLSNNQERVSQHADIQADKHVQNGVPMPQFDDYCEEEDHIEEKEASVPESDDSSSEGDDYMEKRASMPQFDDHVTEEDGEEEVPFYLRGRAAVRTDEYDARADEYNSRYTRNSTNMAVLAASSAHYDDDDDDDDVGDDVAAKVQNSEMVARLHLSPPIGKEKPLVIGNRSAHQDLEAPAQWSIFDDGGVPVSSVAEAAGSRPVDPDAPRRRQVSTGYAAESSHMKPVSTGYAAESSHMKPVSYADGSGKPTTPRKLKLLPGVSEEWDLDDDTGPCQTSGVPSSRKGSGGSPLRQVGQKLSWFSGAGEDSESMSERSFESFKQRFSHGSSSVEDLNLESPRHPSDTVDVTRVPSPRKSYVGMSKRSVRSTRPRPS